MTKWQTRQALYLLGLTGILYLFSCKSQVIVLDDKADVAAAEDGKLFVVHFRQFFVPDNHIAGSRGVQPAHHVKQGGLAAAGGSHNGHKFAVIYREVHAVKGAGDIRLCTVILFQVDSL